MANRQNKKAYANLRGAARERVEHEEFKRNMANQGYGAGTNTQKGRKEQKGIICPTRGTSETPYDNVARGVSRVYVVNGGHDQFFDHHSEVTDENNETYSSMDDDKRKKIAQIVNDMVPWYVSDLGEGCAAGTNNAMVSMGLNAGGYDTYTGGPEIGNFRHLRVQTTVAGISFTPMNTIADRKKLAEEAWGTAGVVSSSPRVGKTITPSELTKDTQIPGAFVSATTRMTSPFGMRTLNGETRMHNGIDFGGGKRSYAPISAKTVATDPAHIEPCFAAFDGKVTIVKMDFAPTGYGCWLEIEHEVTDKGGNSRTIRTRYGHIEATGLKVGDTVTKGQMVGHIGSQGGSTGPHLHFEVRESGKALDPIELFGWAVSSETPVTDGVAESDFPEEELSDEPAAR